jgi:hypothetical protein
MRVDRHMDVLVQKLVYIRGLVRLGWAVLVPAVKGQCNPYF